MTILEKIGVTPGPWTEEGNFSICQDDTGPTICTVYNGVGTKTALKNRKLICATPEMLQALIESVLIDSHNNIKKVQIIQKATGKSWEEISEMMEDNSDELG